MIDPATLTEKDTGRRVIWEISPGAEEPALLGAWSKDMLVIFVHHDGKRLRPIEVEPSQARLADEALREAS